jgi:single-strand DNA-binding protein
MNVVTLTGRATKDIELHALPSGKMVASGTIAVQRSFKNQQGEYEADFIDFQAWAKTGELLAQYVKKGDFFGITGEIRTRTYEKDGVNRKITEVNVTNFDFPQKPKGGGQQRQEQGNYSGNLNVANSKVINNDPFANDGQPIDISDDDLPF